MRRSLTLRTASIIAISFGLLRSVLLADSVYYVDPDYTGGVKNGSSSTPWTTWTPTQHAIVSNASSNGNVTVYFSALKASGTTNQSASFFVETPRETSNTYRMTFDGYSYYNADVDTPDWQPNPSPINVAWTNHQVFNTTAGIGWVTDPAVTMWRPNITMRGFEVSGGPARSAGFGDNLIIEWIYIHDSAYPGNPGLKTHYVTSNDGVIEWNEGHVTSNMIIRNVFIDGASTEGFYVGGTLDTLTQERVDQIGDKIDTVLITNVTVINSGADTMDVKWGVRNLHIVDCTFSNSMGDVGGIVMPKMIEEKESSQTNAVVERCKIYRAGQGTLSAIYMYSHPKTRGFRNVTIRNNIISGSSRGIRIGQVAPNSYNTNIWIYNNLIISNAIGIEARVNSGLFLSNNIFVYNADNDDLGYVGNWTDAHSDYNAFPSGTWGYPYEGIHSTNLTAGNIAGLFVSLGDNYHLNGDAAVVDIGATVPTFQDDLDKVVRPQGSTWDMGPYEYLDVAAPAAFAIIPTLYEFEALTNASPPSTTYWITNTGNTAQTIDYTITVGTGSPWISSSLANGSVASDRDTNTISFNITGMTRGTYNGFVTNTASTNGTGLSTQLFFVTMELTNAPPPLFGGRLKARGNSRIRGNGKLK